MRGLYRPAASALVARRRSWGFTLVELLVALAIMAMLATLSWRSIDAMSRAQALTRERSDALARLQSALGQWGADLNALIDTTELNPLEFDGQLLRLTRRDASEGGLHSDGVRVVAWVRMQRPNDKAAQWVRWQSAPVRQRDELAQAWHRAAQWAAQGAESGASAPASEQGDSAIALLPIGQWQLFYHRGETWGNPLSSIGSESPGGVTVGEDLVPNAVRLVLTLEGTPGLTGNLSSDWIKPTLVVGRSSL